MADALGVPQDFTMDGKRQKVATFCQIIFFVYSVSETRLFAPSKHRLLIFYELSHEFSFRFTNCVTVFSAESLPVFRSEITNITNCLLMFVRSITNTVYEM